MPMTDDEILLQRVLRTCGATLLGIVAEHIPPERLSATERHLIEVCKAAIEDAR